jgi:hypothetical protein
VENLRKPRRVTDPVDAVYSMKKGTGEERETVHSRRLEPLAAQSNKSGKVTDGNI